MTIYSLEKIILTHETLHLLSLPHHASPPYAPLWVSRIMLVLLLVILLPVLSLSPPSFLFIPPGTYILYLFPRQLLLHLISLCKHCLTCCWFPFSILIFLNPLNLFIFCCVLLLCFRVSYSFFLKNDFVRNVRKYLCCI